jgi:hypothetical protein
MRHMTDSLPASILVVHDVGDFVASFVPALADFGRLDARFRLPAATWDQLPEYRDWGFAVFQLKANRAEGQEPWGFMPKRLPGMLQRKANRARQDMGEEQVKRIHPMAFHFPTRLSEALYFPTLHIHDGHVNEKAEFDHTFFFQGEPFAKFALAESEGPAVKFMKVDKAKGIVRPDELCYKHWITGTRPNQDSIVTKGMAAALTQ